MHVIIRLRPLPARNALFGAGIAVAYMNAAGEGIDAPYGALIDLARDIDAGRTDAYDVADRLRSWRMTATSLRRRPSADDGCRMGLR